MGTLTDNVAAAIAELRQGRVTFKMDRTGIVHAPIGKAYFDAQALFLNIGALTGVCTWQLCCPATQGHEYRSGHVCWLDAFQLGPSQGWACAAMHPQCCAACKDCLPVKPRVRTAMISAANPLPSLPFSPPAGALLAAKPEAIKGGLVKYVRTAYLASTMGQAVPVDVQSLADAVSAAAAARSSQKKADVAARA